jgi:hypothetical protein
MHAMSKRTDIEAWIAADMARAAAEYFAADHPWLLTGDGAKEPAKPASADGGAKPLHQG